MEKDKKKPHYLRRFFAFDHLPEQLRKASEPFASVARYLDDALPENAEKTTAMRKLLEAKDCAVRAVLYEALENNVP